MFVDEHGQIRDDDEGVPVCAAILIPHADEHLLRALVGGFRQARPGGSLKARLLSPDERKQAANLIRARKWLMYYYSLGPLVGRMAKIREMNEYLARQIATFRNYGRPGATVEAALVPIEEQFRGLAQGKPGAVYLGLLCSLFDLIAQRLRRRGTLPQVAAWVDEKRCDPLLARFLLRMTFSNNFPEVYAREPGMLVGKGGRARDLALNLGSDGEGMGKPDVRKNVDGLVMADLVAYYTGLRARDANGAKHVDADELKIADEFLLAAETPIQMPWESSRTWNGLLKRTRPETVDSRVSRDVRRKRRKAQRASRRRSR